MTPTAYRRVARRQAGPTGIGGYLLLPIVGLILTIGWNAWNLYHELVPFRRSGAWSALTTPGSAVYHRLWQPLVLFEVFAAVVMVVVPVALLTAMFRRRRSARGFTIAFYIFCCIAVAVDSGSALLFVVQWLRSAGLSEAADSTSAMALRNVYQAALLAAIWIPYFVRSRRVKNTFNRPASAIRIAPASFRAAADKSRGGGRRTALAVVAIAVIAGASVYAFNTYLPEPAGAAATRSPDEAQEWVLQANAAYTSGNWDQAITLYAQAIQADPGNEHAYHGQWSALVENKDVGEALALAKTVTEKFPNSREAWFALALTQELDGRLKDAVASYTRCLALPQPAGVAQAITDQMLKDRLALVTYVTAISEPRVAIAAAVNQVSTSLQGAASGTASLSTAATQVTAVLGTNIAILEKVTPPAYFAAFHTGMLVAYENLKSTCERLAGAASASDDTSLGTAEQSLNEAIDSFNQNDAVGTSLMNDYYGQRLPVAVFSPATPGG